MGRHMGPPVASADRQHARTRVLPGLGEPAVCWPLPCKKLALWVVVARRHVEDLAHSPDMYSDFV